MKEQNSIFCIPHAGGMSYAFRDFRKRSDSTFEYIPMDISGHGRLMKQQLYTRFDDIVDDFYERLKQKINTDKFVLFGHSMGGWIAYELAKRFELEQKIIPQLVVISANVPPRLYRDNVVLDRGDDALRASLLRQGGSMRDAIENEDICKTFLPIIKADYKAIFDYVSRDSTHECIQSDILTFVGDEDCVKQEYVKEWRNMTKGKYQFVLLKGDHFALYHNVEKVDQCIRIMKSKCQMSECFEDNKKEGCE